MLALKSNKKLTAVKSRGRIGGKKASYKEIEDQIVKLALDGMKINQISKITGKDRTTIWRYINKAEKNKTIQRTESHRIKLSREKQAELKHKILEKDAFIKKYPAVKNWVTKREKEAQGSKTKLKRIHDQLRQLRVICDTLKINPYELLAKKNGSSYGGLEDCMADFMQAVVTDTVQYAQRKKTRNLFEDDEEPNYASVYRQYLIAARNFAIYNGLTLPEFPPTHILSGKKTSFGQYAHVKLSWQQIKQAVNSPVEKYGEDSKEVNMFIFYYITGTRANSIYKVESNTINKTLDGWITCRVYEPKQKTTWTKLIPNDNPHFEIFQKYAEKRIRDGQRYLFLDNKQAVKAEFKTELARKYHEIYEELKITEKFFKLRPRHALRHVAAHYWLERANYSHGIVAKIVGWKDVQTLIQCYGEVTEKQIIEIVSKVDFSHA